MRPSGCSSTGTRPFGFRSSNHDGFRLRWTLTVSYLCTEQNKTSVSTHSMHHIYYYIIKLHFVGIRQALKKPHDGWKFGVKVFKPRRAWAFVILSLSLLDCLLCSDHSNNMRCYRLFFSSSNWPATRVSYRTLTSIGREKRHCRAHSECNITNIVIRIVCATMSQNRGEGGSPWYII